MKGIYRLLILPLLCLTCQVKNVEQEECHEALYSYTNPINDLGAEPWAVYHNGTYYYTQGCEDKIILWQTPDLTDLRNATKKEVWTPTDPSNAFHLWGPEIHYIDNKWYIYFAADDGNMDNHQIYVIENSEANPLDGEFTMKGRISTDKDNNWAIHASTFEHKGDRYLIWCGWQKRRVNDEKQCIYIAKMKNPWTLKSERVLISQPEYEWERQWVSPDGSKTAYPIHVNEAPQYFHSKNKDKVLIYYSASGSWTPYYCVGLLTADANSNLLDPSSWSKTPVPVFKQYPENDIYGPGNFCFVPSPDGEEWYVLFHARDIPNDSPGALDSRSPRMIKIEWDENGLPVFPIPEKKGTPLALSSGHLLKEQT